MISFTCLAMMAQPLLSRWASLTAGQLSVENPSSLQLSLMAIATLGTYVLVRRDRTAEVQPSPIKRAQVTDLKERPPKKKAA